MEWLNADEAVFYGMVWAIGFGSSLFVTIGGNNFESINKSFVLGAISGFLAFSIVSFYVGRIDEPIRGHWYYLGLASTIGLASRYQQRILKSLLKKWNIEIDEKDRSSN